MKQHPKVLMKTCQEIVGIFEANSLNIQQMNLVLDVLKTRMLDRVTIESLSKLDLLAVETMEPV